MSPPPKVGDYSKEFISLWGILAAVPLITKRIASVSSLWLRSLIQFIAASVVASSVTVLPVLFVFKIASFNGILTNFLIVPLLGYGAVLAGFLALPFMTLFPSAASLLLWPAAECVVFSNRFIVWCNSLPVLTFHGITGWDMLFFLLFMTGMTFVTNKSLRLVLGLSIPICAVVLHIYVTTDIDGRLHITMLSVGQGESILIRLPDGSTLLVDGGGYLHDTGHDFGRQVLAPALGTLHIGRIDRMIATHDHPDHSGGLPFVINNFDVGEFWSVASVTPEIVTALTMKKVPRRTVAAGDVFTLPGPVIVTVLSPDKSTLTRDSSESNVNEQSLVFRLRYGTFSMIFCADAGFETEQRIIDGHQELKSTVLKVGHHGSRFSTSDDFLERVHPKLALVSAGAGNRFGLPAPRTIDLLRSKRVPLYRTDRDGTIELVTDGIHWSVSTPCKPE